MEDLAREYYRAIDEHDYETLASLLASHFTHDRPDQTIEGREAFVQFMRDERPKTDTSHEIAGVFLNEDDVAVRGRLHRADGSEWFEFVDVFAVEEGEIWSLKTYARESQ